MSWRRQPGLAVATMAAPVERVPAQEFFVALEVGAAAAGLAASGPGAAVV